MIDTTVINLKIEDQRPVDANAMGPEFQKTDLKANGSLRTRYERS